VAPNDQRLAHLRDHYYEIMPGRETPTIYPPVTELIYRATWKVFPGPTAFKVPFAAADVLVLLLLAWMFREEKDRAFRVAVYAWNPLVIVEFAGSGHNDALALLGIVGGLALLKKRPVLASVAIALAAMAKVFPAMILPVWIRRAGWPEKRSGWRAAALAGAACVLVVLPYWQALGAFRANLAHYESNWKNYHASLYTVIDWLTGGGTRIPALVGAAAIWGLALWLAWKRAEPARAAYLLIGTSLVFWPNGYPWYFTWIVPLLCFSQIPHGCCSPCCNFCPTTCSSATESSANLNLIRSCSGWSTRRFTPCSLPNGSYARNARELEATISWEALPLAPAQGAPAESGDKNNLAMSTGRENVHMRLRRILQRQFFPHIGRKVPFSSPAPIAANISNSSDSVAAHSVKPLAVPRRPIRSRGLMLISPRLPMMITRPFIASSLKSVERFTFASISRMTSAPRPPVAFIISSE